MSTDTPYAWGRNPPWDDQESDAYDDAVSNTALEMKKDLNELIREKLEDTVLEYLEVPDKWHDMVIDNIDDFKEQVAQELLSHIKIK